MGDVIYCKCCRGRTPGRPKGIEDFAIAVGGGPCVRKKMTLNVFRQIFLGEFRTVPKIPRFGDFEEQSLEFPSHKIQSVKLGGIQNGKMFITR